MHYPAPSKPEEFQPCHTCPTPMKCIDEERCNHPAELAAALAQELGTPMTAIQKSELRLRYDSPSFVYCDYCTTPVKCRDLFACGKVREAAHDEKPIPPGSLVKTHELKCWPQYFRYVAEGLKNFEIRKNDREFKVGDRLTLREFTPCEMCGAAGRTRYSPDEFVACRACPPSGTDLERSSGGAYTGRKVERVISYVLTKHPGIQDGYAMLGIYEEKTPSKFDLA